MDIEASFSASRSGFVSEMLLSMLLISMLMSNTSALGSDPLFSISFFSLISAFTVTFICSSVCALSLLSIFLASFFCTLISRSLVSYFSFSLPSRLSFEIIGLILSR